MVRVPFVRKDTSSLTLSSSRFDYHPSVPGRFLDLCQTGALTIVGFGQGLAEYVAANVNDALSKGVVVGHDHRHHSKHWAELTAIAFLNRGFKVYLYQGLVHTPLCVLALRSR